MEARPSRLGVSWREAAGGDGIILTRVDYDSPAFNAGLQYGDHILRLNGREIVDGEQFLRAVQASPENATFTLRRAEAEEPITLAAKLLGKPVRLGISWREDDAEPGTLVLARVVPGTPAHEKELQIGDRIYEINGQQFRNGIEFIELVGQATGPTELAIERKGRIRMVSLDLPPLQLEILSAE